MNIKRAIGRLIGARQQVGFLTRDGEHVTFSRPKPVRVRGLARRKGPRGRRVNNRLRINSIFQKFLPLLSKRCCAPTGDEMAGF